MSEEVGPVLIDGHRYIRPTIRVAVVQYEGGTKCVVPAVELVDLIDGGSEYTVSVKTISVAEFERMPEFAGW